MQEVTRQHLDHCTDAVREVGLRLLDEGHAESDVVNAFLCELLAFKCETPDEVESYLTKLLHNFRRHRDSIEDIYQRRCH